MRADDLILFSQVVEMGSFSKVAETNNLTNSVVSKRIARLEEELGVQLLYRTTRKLTLTEAGKALTHGAKNVKQATLEAMDAVSGFGENISGHIKMSVPTISGDLILADAVAEFCNTHPGLSVDMSLDNRFVDLVEGGYDLVIRTGYLEDSSLIARHILDSQWVVCASPAYVARNSKPVKPEDLTQHNCLQYAYQTTGASEWEFKGKEGNYIVRVSGFVFNRQRHRTEESCFGWPWHCLCTTMLGVSRHSQWPTGGSVSRASRKAIRHLRSVSVYSSTPQ